MIGEKSQSSLSSQSHVSSKERTYWLHLLYWMDSSTFVDSISDSSLIPNSSRSFTYLFQWPRFVWKRWNEKVLCATNQWKPISNSSLVLTGCLSILEVTLKEIRPYLSTQAHHKWCWSCSRSIMPAYNNLVNRPGHLLDVLIPTYCSWTCQAHPEILTETATREWWSSWLTSS
jgi:hypothetical protein